MPSRRRASPSASPSGAGSRASRCSALRRPPPRRRDDAGPAPSPPRPGRRRGRAAGAGPPSCPSPRDWSRRLRARGGPGSAARPDRLRWRGPRGRRCGARRRPRPRPGPASRPLAPQQVDAVVGKPPLLAGVGPVGDHEVAPGERRLDVDLGARRRLAGALDRLARPQQRLRRDARPVRALAPDSSRSTIATRRPPSASAPAQCSPGEPPPITMTS